MTRQCEISRDRAGFTLMEVLVAITILGTALFVLMEAQYSAVRMHGAVREELLLRNLLEEALAMAEVEMAAGNLSGSGEFGKRHRGFAYTFESEEVSVEDFPGLYEVLVEVQGPNEQRQEIRTFMFSAVQ